MTPATGARDSCRYGAGWTVPDVYLLTEGTEGLSPSRT